MLRTTRITISQIVLALVATALASLSWADASVQYARPNVDYSQYKQFVVSPLDISNMRIVPPAWADKPESKKWTMSQKNEDFLRSLYMESITKGIESSGKFKAAKAPGTNTILVEIQLTRLTPWAARGEKVTTKGSGELKFEAELRDAETNDLLVLIEGVQEVGKDYQENTSFNHQHNLKQHFERWGKWLSNALAEAHAKK